MTQHQALYQAMIRFQELEAARCPSGESNILDYTAASLRENDPERKREAALDIAAHALRMTIQAKSTKD